MAKKKAPAWFISYFEAALDQQQRLQEVLEASGIGIRMVREMPVVVKALTEVKGEQPDRVERADQLASFAQAEIDRDFSTVSWFGVLAQWSWFEAFVIDIAALWVTKKHKALETLDGPKVKIDISKFVSLRSEERARFIIEAIDREMSGPLRLGTNRFDKLLHSIGIDVRADRKTKDTLFEMQQVRNCIAHRFGRVDKKLIAHCPQLKLKDGEELKLKISDIHRYGEASGSYLLAVLFAAGDGVGTDLRPSEEKEKSRAEEESAESQEGKAR